MFTAIENQLPTDCDCSGAVCLQFRGPNVKEEADLRIKLGMEHAAGCIPIVERETVLAHPRCKRSFFLPKIEGRFLVFRLSITI